MSSVNDGGPAFPGSVDTHGYGPGHHIVLPNGELEWITVAPGMSLRDFFAAKALGSVLDWSFSHELPEPNADKVAKLAYRYADSMLTERAKTPGIK